MRLIDADALEQDFYDRYDRKGYRNGKNLIYAAWLLLKKLIDNAPTIEAKPVVHAHWIELFDGENPTYPCSNCMNEQWRTFDFCPCCGARMDENYIAEDSKKEPICVCAQDGVKIPVISMEDVPKMLEKELPSVEENPILRTIREIEKESD